MLFFSAVQNGDNVPKEKRREHRCCRHCLEPIVSLSRATAPTSILPCPGPGPTPTTPIFFCPQKLPPEKNESSQEPQGGRVGRGGGGGPAAAEGRRDSGERGERPDSGIDRAMTGCLCCLCAACCLCGCAPAGGAGGRRWRLIGVVVCGFETKNGKATAVLDERLVPRFIL